MIALGPLGTDLTLAGLPTVTVDLQATDSAAQLSLLAYLTGLGLGHFIWGPVSDRFGRRGPLLLGLALFTLSGVVCALTPSIELLLTARVLQGLAGSAGLVISRAIIRDLYDGPDITRIFGRISIVFGIAPIVGPLIGAAIMQFAGWRGTYAGLAILGAAFLLTSLALIHETLPPERRVHGEPGAQRDAWIAPLKHPVFVVNAVLMALSSVFMFGFVAYTPFVLQTERGIDEALFAWLFALTASAVLVGGQLAALLARRFAGHVVVRTAYGIAAILSIGILLAVALGWPTWSLLACMWLTILNISTIQPTALALAIEPFARGAGTAAAIVGGAQFLIASAITGTVSTVFGASGLVMGVLLLSALTVAWLVATIGTRLAAGRDPGGMRGRETRVTITKGPTTA